MPSKFPGWKSFDRYPYGSEHGFGIATCIHCGRASRYKLNWPNDAFYSIEIAKHTLWANDRDFLVLLFKFVNNPKNSAPKKADHEDIRRIPRVFFLKKYREALIRRLANLLEH